MYTQEGLDLISDQKLSKIVSVECMRFHSQDGFSPVPPSYATDPTLAERARKQVIADFPGIEKDMPGFQTGASNRVYARDLCEQLVEAVRTRRGINLRPCESPAEIRRVR
mgnify:CR=1 FL=1